MTTRLMFTRKEMVAAAAVAFIFSVTLFLVIDPFYKYQWEAGTQMGIASTAAGSTLYVLLRSR